MSVVEPEDQLDLPAARQQALTSRVLLFAPVMGHWLGMYQLPRNKTEVKADEQKAEEGDVTVPRAILMTDKYPLDRSGVPYKKRLQKVDSQLAQIKDRFTVKFKVSGVRIMPKAHGAAFMEELYGDTLGRLRRRLQTLRDQDGHTDAIAELETRISDAEALEGANAPDNTPVFNPDRADDKQSVAYNLHVIKREFATDWPRIRAEIATKNTVFKYVADKVPDASADMRDKFYLDVVPIELAGTVQSTELTVEDLDEHAAIVRDACHRRVEEAIEEMVAEPRQQLADALANLQNLINRDGRVSTKSFKPVREAIAKVRLFDFVANDRLLEQITVIEKRLDTTVARTLDSKTAANNGFSAALNTVITEVQDELSAAEDRANFGRNFRGLDLR